MGTHFSILAWRIPRTEEPAGCSHGVAKSQTRLKQLSTNVLSVVRCQNVSQVLSMDLGENCEDTTYRCFGLGREGPGWRCGQLL